MMTSRPRRDAIRKAAKAVAESTQLICDDLDQFHDLRRAVWRFVHWADHTSAKPARVERTSRDLAGGPEAIGGRRCHANH